MSAQTMPVRQHQVTKKESKRDWGLIVGGILLTIAGFVVAAFPGMTLLGIAAIAGVLFIVAGIVEFVTYANTRGMEGAGWALAGGICDIILGIIFMFQPLLSVVIIPWMCGIAMCVYGIYAIVASIQLRNAMSGWGWLLACGILGIMIGVSFFVIPEYFAIFLGAFLIVRGVSMGIYGANTSETTVYEESELDSAFNDDDDDMLD